jgi:cysteine desulfurase
MEKRFVYADHAATTPVTERVREAMMPFFGEEYGNPSALYRKGRDARAALEDARQRAADALGCTPDEVFFTSCGTESDNWAIKGAAVADAGKRRIVTSAIEHHAVLRACGTMQLLGYGVTVLPVTANGLVEVGRVAEAITSDTALVSVMAANNEVGTIQPIDEIGALCRARGVLFHTDAVQAVGNVEIHFDRQPIDLLSLSGHKIGAPKGSGILCVRRGTTIRNLLDGGGQERGRRSGTENVAFAVGLAAALEDACRDVTARAARKAALRDRLFDGLLAVPETLGNGDRVNRLCTNVSVCFRGVSGNRLLAALDQAGIAASAGSACHASSAEPSHVLAAMGVPPEFAAGALRLTIGDDTTDEDIDYMLRVIPEVVGALRRDLPFGGR